MSLSPSGLFGAHHYYLRNYKLALLYSFTLGVFGTGWLVDIFRITDLVKATNVVPPENDRRTVTTARILCASPLGFLGAHHFYLNRPLHGFLYALTLGWFGIGLLYDMCRMSLLYERYKNDDKDLHIDDAYMLWFPLGIFGLHQLYLGRKKWALLYLLTGGFFAVGWIIDAFRIKQLLNEQNKKKKPNEHIAPIAVDQSSTRADDQISTIADEHNSIIADDQISTLADPQHSTIADDQNLAMRMQYEEIRRIAKHNHGRWTDNEHMQETRHYSRQSNYSQSIDTPVSFNYTGEEM